MHVRPDRQADRVSFYSSRRPPALFRRFLTSPDYRDISGEKDYFHRDNRLVEVKIWHKGQINSVLQVTPLTVISKYDPSSLQTRHATLAIFILKPGTGLRHHDPRC
jgi:hypothetical protein